VEDSLLEDSLSEGSLLAKSQRKHSLGTISQPSNEQNLRSQHHNRRISTRAPVLPRRCRRNVTAIRSHPQSAIANFLSSRRRKDSRSRGIHRSQYPYQHEYVLATSKFALSGVTHSSSPHHLSPVPSTLFSSSSNQITNSKHCIILQR